MPPRKPPPPVSFMFCELEFPPMWFADSRGNRMQHFCGDCNDRKCFIICLIKSSPTNMISLDKLFIHDLM